MEKGTPILTTQNLCVQIGNRCVVNNISFILHAGEALAIVGESGSGKSLTALSVMGLLPNVDNLKLSGTMLFSTHENQQTDLLLSGSKEMNGIRGKHITMVFQDPLSSLNPSMKCGKQAVEPLLNHSKLSRKQAKNQILHWFSKVQLPDPQNVWHAYPHQLSGGQRQRVMLAMAMAASPKILIADEPTTALDVTVQAEIIDLMRGLCRESGTALIFISHDLALVSNIADTILVMRQGICEEQGKALNVLRKPQSAYTRALLLCRPQPDKQPDRLPTVADIEQGKSTLHNNQRPKQSDETILHVQNLNVWYPSAKNQEGSLWFKACDNVSFQLKKGETLGLVGESGCGKSTLSRAVLQLIKPTSGTVLFDGINLVKSRASVMRRLRTKLQIVFQDPYASLTPSMRIRDALLEPMHQHNVFKRRSECEDYAVYILEKTGLDASDLQKYPHQFSGGQRQRIVIARALVLKPRILFCDESVSALDVSVQAQVLNLLNDLRDEFGLTYVFISHDMNVVAYMSDRIMVMHRGKIVETGNKEEIIHDPKEEYTRKLIHSVPIMKI